MSIEATARKFARLQAPGANLVPSKGSTGQMERWQVEDAATITAAIGYYAARRPKRRLPIVLMMMRYWPEGLRQEQVSSLINTTTGLLYQSIEPHFKTMPRDTKLWITRLLNKDELAKQLLKEFRDPCLCNQCRGLGEVWRIVDAHNNPVAPIKIKCPSCQGACTIPMGYHRRAALACMPKWSWLNHLQTPYTNIINLYQNDADAAASGVMAKLG